jgi:hypothetical protein
MSRSRVSTALWLAGLAAAGVGVGVAVTVAVLHKSRSTTETPPEPTEVSDGVVHVIAPPGGCWQLALGESDSSPVTRVEQGCGPGDIPIDADEGLVSLERQPRDWWNLGMRIEVNGVVVRDIRPAPYLGLTVHWSRRFPEKTIHARLTAPDTGCWKATIESEVEKGCGSKDLVLDVQGDINVAIERDPPAAWTWCLNLEADGKVFQTYGPDSNPQYALGFGYGSSDYPGNTPDAPVPPVTC